MTTLLLALALGGCKTAPGGLPALTPPAPETDHAKEPDLTASLPLPVPRPKEKGQQPIEPSKLVGLTQDEIRALIGAPASFHEEAPAVVWSYSSAGCGLDISFYLDLASQTFRALTYDLKPKGAKGLSGSACLASLRPAAP